MICQLFCQKPIHLKRICSVEWFDTYFWRSEKLAEIKRGYCLHPLCLEAFTSHPLMGIAHLFETWGPNVLIRVVDLSWIKILNLDHTSTLSDAIRANHTRILVLLIRARKLMHNIEIVMQSWMYFPWICFQKSSCWP